MPDCCAINGWPLIEYCRDAYEQPPRPATPWPRWDPDWPLNQPLPGAAWSESGGVLDNSV